MRALGGAKGSRLSALLRAVAACVLATACSLGAGCGYKLLHTGKSQGAALWISPVVDDSTEPLFGAHVRSALAREAVDRAGLALAGRGDATSFLAVHVLSAQEAKVAYVAGDRPRQYLITGEITATLTDRSGRVLWKGDRLRADRLFAAGGSVEETQVNKDRALDLLAEDLAREVLRRVALTVETLPADR